MVETGGLVGAVICAVMGVGVLLVITGIRGVPVDASRPEGRVRRGVRALSDPVFSGRLGAGVITAGAVLVLTHWPVAAAGLGALVITWPRLFGGTRTEQTQIHRLEALVIWTESLRDTIAAHASLERAIPASTQHAPELIRPALIRLAGQISVRAPLDRALLMLAADLDDPSADLVIAALILNVRRRGDRLAVVLGGLATAAREELDVRRTISAGRAGLRRGVQIIIVLTVAFGLYLTVFSRDYMRPYDSPGGQVALAVVLGMFAAGFAWMRQLSEGPTVQPFLARPGQGPSDQDVQVITTLTGVSEHRARQLSTTSSPSDPIGGAR